MTFWQRRQQADHLRAIPLEQVLPLCGGQRDPHDQHKWHTAAGVLSVTGAKFMNWNGGRGGGGAIDLVIHLHHLDFKAAVDWLAQHFPGSVPSLPLAPTPPLQFLPPPPDPGKLDRVLQYLVDHRKIAPALLEPLIGSGTLYADTRANAVFLLLGKEKLPVGAELRGTTARPWHPGRKRIGAALPFRRSLSQPQASPASQSSCVNPPLMPSVALRSIPKPVVSPLPAPGPTQLGSSPCWIKRLRYIVALMPIPLATRWPMPCWPCTPASNAFALPPTTGTTCSKPKHSRSVSHARRLSHQKSKVTTWKEKALRSAVNQMGQFI